MNEEGRANIVRELEQLGIIEAKWMRKEKTIETSHDTHLERGLNQILQTNQRIESIWKSVIRRNEEKHSETRLRNGDEEVARERKSVSNQQRLLCNTAGDNETYSVGLPRVWEPPSNSIVEDKSSQSSVLIRNKNENSRDGQDQK